MHVLKKIGIATGLVASAALSVALALPAQADTGAVGGDVVGVGSDTLQNGANFAFDGYPGDPGGYNNAGNKNRAVNIDATGDANGRAVYDGTCGAVDSTGTGKFCDGQPNPPAGGGAAPVYASPNLLAGSVVLRAGQKPVVRPNGSGGGVGALIADSASPGYEGLPARSIQFARMSRVPSSGDVSSCTSKGSTCGGLHVFEAATDTLAIAHVSSGYNGPAVLTTQNLADIYSCKVTKWNQVGGTSANTIHALIPQSGSGTRNFFIADLTAQDSTFTLGTTCGIRTVQEHDPTGIYADNSAADAIEPFSTGKLALINNGYFAQGVAYTGTNAANGAYTPGFLTASTSGANYNSPRGLYFVVRQTDFISTSPFQVGGAQNFVSALFTSTQSAIRSGQGQSELTDAGFTPNYIDCGIAPNLVQGC